MEDFDLKAAWHQGKKAGHEMELAQAYVPFQTMDQLFEPEEGLKKGTIFPELYRPHRRKPHKDMMKYKMIYKMEGE